MAHSSRSTSPDPITMPSSPLAPRSHNAVLPGRRRPRPVKAAQAAKTSPSKSFVMDTGPAGDASPWRIKVTVEAEPQDASSSPTKKRVQARTTKVPLKGADSSSPAKKASVGRKKALPEESESETVQKKRKGTPVRRRSARNKPVVDDELDVIEDGGDFAPTTTSTPSKKPVARKRKTPAKPTSQPTERFRRLTQAREELDVALREAVGTDEVPSRTMNKENERIEDDAPVDDEVEADFAPGDMTIANDEDFTMVSVETLESMKQNTSQLLENSGLEVGDKSAASVSYMPSSPPVRYGGAVQYPDISHQMSEAKDIRFSGRASSKHDTIENAHGALKDRQDTSSNATMGATAEQAIIIEDDAEAGAEHSDNEPQAEDDIWAEEASRSIEEEQQSQQQRHNHTRPEPAEPSPQPKLADLFGSEPLKPPRPKIPRTWRRSSGANFSYVDSPEYGALRKTSGGGASTDGDGGGGVLTPPSTDDEEEDTNVDEANHDGDDHEVDIDFTQPDAAATQLQTEPDREDVLSPGSGSDSSVASPDAEGEDTGLFWQTHLPNVYPSRSQRPRYQRQQRAMDLSELLNLHKSGSPAKASKTSVNEGRSDPDSVRHSNNQPPHDPLSKFRKRASETADSEIEGKEKVVSSPLRRSLLKGSKIGGASLPDVSRQQGSRQRVWSAPRGEETHSSMFEQSEQIDGTAVDSFESKASDQRQLLEEMGMVSSGKRQEKGEATDEGSTGTYEESEYEIAPRSNTAAAQVGDEDEETEEDDQSDERETERFDDQTAQSYEEHLNLESPQKIKVKFNDSTTTTTTTTAGSSVLAPKKEYPPLFSSQAKKQYPPLFGASQTSTTAPRQHDRPVSLTSKDSAATEPQPGIFTRLSTTFWSAVVRPTGPTSILPTESEPIYSPALRRDIRSRYGVVSDQHPWTMVHMRTLHRLLNSCTSGKNDSIVPKEGPLPSPLARLVGKKLVSVTPDFTWTFTTQHAHVVDAFMQTLVPSHIAESIENGEMEFLGDREARKHRGEIAGRRGDMVVFTSDGVKEPRGTIQREWVVKAVGNCVMANIDTAERRAEEERRLRSVREERKAWERRNGVVYEDYEEEGEGEGDGSSVLPQVQLV